MPDEDQRERFARTAHDPSASNDPDGERLRRALHDPSAWVDEPNAARARYVLCRSVLDLVGRAAQGLRHPVLAVKGAALAHTVYPRPWLREMNDVDLLVHPADRAALVERLEHAGCERVSTSEDRRFSATRLGDAGLSYRAGPFRWAVDVHVALDKIVRRLVPYDLIRDRSVPCEALAGLRVPSLEDHALLVALHASASTIDHPVGLLDLELLLRAGADETLIVERALRWKLRSALYGCLVELRAAGSTSVESDLLDALRPGWIRRRLIPLRRQGDGGLRWVLGQTFVRDDPLRWLAGLGRYGALRLADRVDTLLARDKRS